MRFHVVSLPHTQTTKAFSWCAYSSKVLRFCGMMRSLGHEVFLYAGEQNEADVTEHVPVLTLAEQELYDGAIPTFAPDNPAFATMAGRVIPAIQERRQPGDFLCIIGGSAQKPIADAHPDLMTVEYGIGYGGVFADYRVFESYAWLHTVYGALYGTHDANGRFFDCVIPNSYSPGEFDLGKGDGGYLLYIGRLIERKGLQVVADIAKATGRPLVVAGDGDKSLIPEGAKYAGVVGPIARNALMGGAVATLVPTLYVEPFGGVAVESMLTGTPVITTDWGAFSETVTQGETGYRCRTLGEFVWAVDHAQELNRERISEQANSKWSTDVVRYDYEAYFEQLQLLRGEGWYDATPRRPMRVA